MIKRYLPSGQCRDRPSKAYKVKAGSERTRGLALGHSHYIDLGVLLISHNQQGIRCHQSQQCPNTFEYIKMIASSIGHCLCQGRG